MDLVEGEDILDYEGVYKLGGDAYTKDPIKQVRARHLQVRVEKWGQDIRITHSSNARDLGC
jgi:hypothetical protein